MPTRPQDRYPPPDEDDLVVEGFPSRDDQVAATLENGAVESRSDTPLRLDGLSSAVWAGAARTTRGADQDAAGSAGASSSGFTVAMA